jgi:predicted metalloendopeptidase
MDCGPSETISASRTDGLNFFSSASIIALTQSSVCQVNGKLTLGEAIADSGGLKMAWEAFLAKEKPSQDEKRMFFLAMGQTWCSKVE